MNLRSINLRTEAPQGAFLLSGVINETGVLAGSLSFFEKGTASSVTVAVAGVITGTNPEDLPIVSQDTVKLGIGGSAQIQTDGSTTASLTGTLPNGDALTSTTLTGTTESYPVHYRDPQLSAEGLEVLNGITTDQPCLLLQQLRAAKLRLISGQAESRVEFEGRTLYFHPANLSELDKEITKYAGLCVASGGTDLEAETPTRTRRQIRFNPYC